jgi:hypothetical protein
LSEAILYFPVFAGTEQLREFLGSAVLRRLRDEDPGVVKAALNIPSLVRISAREPLFEALSAAFSTSIAALEGRLELLVDSKAAAAIARNVLRVLVGDFVGAHPEFSERIAALLLDNMLVMAKTRKVNREVIIQAAKLPGLPPGLAELVEETDKDGVVKGTKAEKDAVLNNALVAALAENLLTSVQEQVALLRSALMSGARSRPLVLQVLLGAFGRVKKTKARGLLEAAMPLLESEWLRAAGLGNLDEDPLPEGIVDLLRDSVKSGFSSPMAVTPWYKVVRVSPERASLALVMLAYESAVGLTETARLGPLFSLLASGPKQFGDDLLPVLKQILEQAAGAGLSKKAQWLGERFMTRTGVGGEVSDGTSVGARVQEPSLELLADVVQNEELATGDLFSLTPKLLVALASAAKGVRKAALKVVRNLWVRAADLENAQPPLDATSKEADVSVVRKVLEAVWGERRHFRDDGAHLSAFFFELLSWRDGDDSAALMEEEEKSTLRKVFNVPKKWAVLKFLVGAVVETLDTNYQRAVLLGALRTAIVSIRDEEQGVVVGQLQPLVFTLLGGEGGVNAGTAVEGPDDTALLVEFARLFTSDLARKLTVEGGMATSLGTFVLALQTGSANSEMASDAVAIAAVEQIDQQFFYYLNPPAQDWLTSVLLGLMSAPRTEALHVRVRRALGAIELSAGAIGRLISLLMEDPGAVPTVTATPAKKKKKGAASKSDVETVSPAHRVLAGSLELGTALLELLQWKELTDKANSDALAQQLSALLRRLIERSWPLGLVSEQTTDSQELPVSMPPPRVVYAMQLALASLERIAVQSGEKIVDASGIRTRAGKKGGPFDVDLVVRCVREAPDAPTRNHALALLAVLAKVLPNEVRVGTSRLSEFGSCFFDGLWLLLGPLRCLQVMRWPHGEHSEGAAGRHEGELLFLNETSTRFDTLKRMLNAGKAVPSLWAVRSICSFFGSGISDFAPLTTVVVKQ